MSGRIVLVVEDNEPNMLLTTVLLEAASCHALQARSGHEAIEVARAEHPNLVLMDVGLPDMSGLEAASVLKNDPVTKAIPIIALTAYAMRGDKERILAAGCDDYIAKPIDTRNFMQMIERFLN